MRLLGDVAKPLQPAYCVRAQIIGVHVIGWGKGGTLMDDVLDGLFLGMHGQAADGRRPQRCIFALNRINTRPYPV